MLFCCPVYRRKADLHSFPPTPNPIIFSWDARSGVCLNDVWRLDLPSPPAHSPSPTTDSVAHDNSRGWRKLTTAAAASTLCLGRVPQSGPVPSVFSNACPPSSIPPPRPAWRNGHAAVAVGQLLVVFGGDGGDGSNEGDSGFFCTLPLRLY